MQSRTFRQASCVVFVGSALALVGAAIACTAAYHIITGVPLIQADSKYHAGRHIASTSELMFDLVGGLPILLFGIVVYMHAINSGITIDEDGIYSTNFIRRKYFQCA